MTFEVEIVLRERDYAVTERVVIPALPGEPDRAPADWTDPDVAQVLKEILLAIDRVKNPSSERRHVALRGFSWIVNPYKEGGVVIALEMTLGAVVAGPFEIAEAHLSGMISRVMAGGGTPQLPASGTVH